MKALALSLLVALPSLAFASDPVSLTMLQGMPDESVQAFQKLQGKNPGLASALVAMRAAHVCRGTQLTDEDLNNAVGVLSGAMSPSFRDDPDVSHGRFEREQINALADNAKAFDALRKATVDCPAVESRSDDMRAELKEYGERLVTKLGRVVQQTQASSEITIAEPIVNITVQEPKRSIWPWNW